MSYFQHSSELPEWVGKPPVNWRTDWLKWYVRLTTERPNDHEIETLPYIANEDIASWTGALLNHDPQPTEADGRKFLRDDVLFNKLRPYLAKVFHAPFSGVSSGELLCLRSSDQVLPRHLFYVASSKAFVDAVNAETFGSKMPRADWEIVGHQPLPLPPLETQKRIAAFLDEKTAQTDALIAKKRALLDRLAEKRQAIITQAVTKGLNPAAAMKDSGIDWLGQVPGHWDVWPLKRVLATSQYGVSASLEPSGNVAILRMGNLQDGELDFSDLRYLDEIEPGLLLHSRDVVFNRTNSLDLVGKAAIYRGNYEGQLSLASYLVLFRFDERYDPEFAVYVMGTDVLMALGRTLALPSIGQANLNPNRYAAISFPVPPLSEQREIVAYIIDQLDLLLESEGKIATSIERLTEYRSALITAAVTGKIEELQE
jgi:type I restriction enzyme S subunit